MLSDGQRRELRERIETDLQALESEIEALEAACEPIAPDCSLGRLTRLEAMQEQQVSRHMLKESNIRRNKLRYALGKIDAPEYGICIECEEAIPFERLLLMPETSKCVVCAQL
jgi:DnaK suppressor protein